MKPRSGKSQIENVIPLRRKGAKFFIDRFLCDLMSLR